MSSYVVLARKYRPRRLADLVGQEQVARAVSNAIRMGRVAHAFLFCGARGVGKTSTARILAACLNCEKGPTPEPCGECAPCREIAIGSSLDVHELDAASNRGINEIRELRDGVGYAPSRDRHKIYIIDEAHMLTTEAANAFLKTLEEPPPHVVFILATTDPQRLPVTIRSRCQRQDFRRVTAQDSVRCMEQILAAEGIEAEQDALYVVAREGDGSMRDALSILDQVIAFCGTKITAQDTANLLGVADRARTKEMIAALLGHDVTTALSALGAANDFGVDLKTFARTLANEARDMLVIRLAGEQAASTLVDRSRAEIKELAQITLNVQSPELERLTAVLLELAESAAGARHPRLVLEVGLVRLCRAPTLLEVETLVGRIDAALSGAIARGGSVPLLTHRGTQPAPPARITTSTQPIAASASVLAPPPAPRQVVVAEPAQPPGRVLTNADLRAWQGALRDTQHGLEASLLDHCGVMASTPGRVTLGMTNAFYLTRVRTGETLRLLADAASKAFGGRFTIDAQVGETSVADVTLGAVKAREQEVQRQAVDRQLREHPTTAAVIRALGGQVLKVRTDEPDAGA